MHDIKIGDGITEVLYTDRHAYTVIKVTPKGFRSQRDIATRLTAPEIIPGGFSGVCVNASEIAYNYEPNPTGQIITCRLHKDGKYYHGARPIVLGRHEYYDYNF